jgi:elongation factor 1-alpha
MSTQPTDSLSVAMIGHVDSGKSTITGHLVHLLGSVSAETIATLAAEAEASGKSTFKFAWVSDKLRSERERGVSIEVTLHTVSRQ